LNSKNPIKSSFFSFYSEVNVCFDYNISNPDPSTTWVHLHIWFSYNILLQKRAFVKGFGKDFKYIVLFILTNFGYVLFKRILPLIFSVKYGII